MLSLRAIKLFLKHFDAIDDAVSRKLVRRFPWQEEALTSIFCDLLDEEVQKEENLNYSIRDLHEDLLLSDEPIDIHFKIETHKYPKHMERWVTQSDFGLIIHTQDQFAKFDSKKSWLMQAKRLFQSSKTLNYETSSKFESVDKKQHKRIKQLNKWAGEEFVKYFLYCPRPKRLQKNLREVLNNARTASLSDHIFDYALGLELRDDLLSENPTIAAGMFVANVESAPLNFLEVHGQIFNQTTPFSWFILQHIVQNQGFSGHSDSSSVFDRIVSQGGKSDEIARLVRGDYSVLDEIELPENMSKENTPPILPAHTIEVSVTCGLDRPRYD